MAAACGPNTLEDARHKVLRSAGEDVLLPAYAEVEARAETLTERADELCREASEKQLEGARKAWDAARAPWKRATLFAFGPYSAFPERLGPKLDFWPARPDAIEAVLTGSEALGDSLENRGAPERGFPAIEYLLFQEGVQARAFTDGERRCEYLGLLARDLEVSARAIHDAWAPEHGNYLGELLDAGEGSKSFDSLEMAFTELVHRMGFMLENLRKDQLGSPLGEKTGSPDPTTAESRFSGRSLDDLRDALNGLELVYLGTASADAVGLDYYLTRKGFRFRDRFALALRAARRALDDVPEPLTDAVISDPERVATVSDRLGDLQRLIQVDIANALSLGVGFNDNDGD
jgi:predicted lipoprotein